MESLLKMEDRTAPVESTQKPVAPKAWRRRNAQRRRTKNVTRTAVFSILFSAVTALPVSAANTAPTDSASQARQRSKDVDLSPMVGKSTYLSPADTQKQISVILSLPLGDSAGAAEFVRRVSDPKDPLYRKYITPAEFAARYGANANDYAALKQWALANGVTITHEAGARTSLTVRGSVGQFQANELPYEHRRERGRMRSNIHGAREEGKR